MSKVASSGEDHSGAPGPDRLENLVVPPGAAWLDDRCDAGVERQPRAVGEREERIAREDGAGEIVAVLARLLDRDPDGVDPAHLPRADADRLQAPCQHDRIRGDVLGDAPREEQVAPTLVVELAAGDLHRLALVDRRIALLHEQAAEHALVVALARR